MEEKGYINERGDRGDGPRVEQVNISEVKNEALRAIGTASTREAV